MKTGHHSLKKPNVVLICVDQWRGDCLGIDDHHTVQTPFLDQLALRGCRFSRAYSSCPTCIPARAALLTGLGQRTHGRVGYQDGVAWNYRVNLAGEFTRHGYQTQAIGKMHVYPERLQMGFQNVILHDGYLHFARKNPNHDMIDDYLPWLRERLGRRADYFDHGVSCNSYVARPWDKDESLHPTNFVMEHSIDFLRRRDPTKPFFLFMSFHRPHPPYDPPAWALDMYKTRAMPRPPVGNWTGIWSGYKESKRPDCFAGEIHDEVLQRARAGYYGHMTHIDHQINRFIETLQEHKLDKNTWIMFVSDHGEMMGDHNMFRKAYPYEGSARVPLILAGPEDSGLPKNRIVNEVVELRDVMPTLLDCAGLPVPKSVEGKSVLGLTKGQRANWRSHIHGEHLIFDQSLHWLTDGHRKYVWCSKKGEEQFFDLDKDPSELTDLSGNPGCREGLGVWRKRLIEELRGREEKFTDGKRLVPGKPVKPCLSHILKTGKGV